MKPLLITVIILSLVTLASATTILVPSQYPTIQAGINAAVDGDTVLVADGTYTGSGNYNMDFLGKAIVVISENGPELCLIDCDSLGRGFYFHTNEDSNSVLSGFTITHGFGEGAGIFCITSAPIIENCIFLQNNSDFDGGGISCFFGGNAVITDCVFEGNNGGCWGGGIFIDASLPVISNCSFLNNIVYEGGGIFICEASPLISYCNFNGNRSNFGGAVAYDIGGVTIVECNFARNFATWWGGALYFKYGDAIIEHCVFSGNSCGENGGAVAVNMAEAEFSNCTISGNSALGNGGGLFVHWSAGIVVENCIVEGNFGNGGLYGDGEYSFSNISYGDSYDNEGGNFAGIGYPAGIGIIDTVNINGDSCDVYYNIFQDPLFADPINGNFQITWANFPIPDSTKSPCIDAGDPNSPLDPDSTIVDIGAFYFDQRLPIEDLTISIEGNDIRLQWFPIPIATIYHIYRSTEPYFDISGMTLITSIADTSYIDANVLTGNRYFYRVNYEY